MSSDQGVAMLRLLLQRQVDVVAAGRDPVGVAFNEADAYVKFDAGQYLDDAFSVGRRRPRRQPR